MTKRLIRCRTRDKAMPLWGVRTRDAGKSIGHLIDMQPIQSAGDLNERHKAFWGKFKR